MEELKLTFADYKDYYEGLLKDGHEPSDEFVCLSEDGTFTTLRPQMAGYKKAVDKVAIPQAKTCKTCDQEIEVGDPTVSKKVLDNHIKNLKTELYKKYDVKGS